LKIDLYKISVTKESEAEEILMEIRDDGKDFPELATKYSNDETTNLSAGYFGKVGRGQLPMEIEQKLFTSNEGDVFGPTKEGDFYSLFKVGKQYQPELDDKMKTNLKDTLFNMWQNQLIQSMKIEVGGGEE
jgi:parvulin-like peptidyl-prolyl isomerase